MIPAPLSSLRSLAAAFAVVASLALAAASAQAVTITVNSAADPGGFNSQITIPQLGATITLRDAIAAVRNTGGTHTITFAPSLAGQTISLSQADANSGGYSLLPHQLGLPSVDLTIQGLTGNGGVTIALDPSGPRRGLMVCVGEDLSLTVNDLTFTGGDVSQSNGWGGAFNIVGTNVNLNRCTLTGNKANIGGAIYVSDSTLHVTNCTIAGNTSYNSGGGIYHYLNGPVTLTHTTITNNSSGRGGGFFNYSGGDLLVNSIVAGNRAFLFGNDLDGNGNATVSPASHHNLIGHAGSAAGLSNGVNGNIVGLDPLLNNLANNGGPTPTAALSPGSPALNAAASGVESTDQRGVSRPQGAGADIGAYELVSGAPTTFTSDSHAAFAIGISNSFNASASGVPAPTFSLSGTLPAGVTLTSAGVLSGNPGPGTQGEYPLTLIASNAAGQTTQAFTLTVINAVVVTTAIDEDNGSTNPALGTGTSLREAINFANTQAVQTITFAPQLAGQSIDLTTIGDNSYGASALRIDKNITIQGLTGNSGITIRRASSSNFRPFLVFLDASLTLNDLTIADGFAQLGGGIFNFSTLKMNRCTLRNNTATFKGGGLASGGGGNGQRVTLTNCTLANNRTQFTGGGLSNDSTSILNLINVTIAGNTSTNANAGMDVNGTVVAINTIVAGNTAPSGAADIGGGCDASSHHNLVGTGGSGGLVNGVNGNIVGVQNPHLGNLASNGGPTQTVALEGSAAINAGATVVEAATDQRGVVRPQLGAPDIGAYEFEGTVTPSLIVTTTADELDFTSDPNFGAGTSLREALNYAQLLGGAQTITFSPSLAGQTVTLVNGWNDAKDSSALRVTGEVTLQGLTNSEGVTIAMADGVQKRHLYVAAGGNLTVSHLTFTGGNASDFGGSIWNQGSLTVRNSTFTGNTAGNEGGAIQSWGDTPLLLIENSTFSGNTSNGVGGAIDCGATSMSFHHVTLTNNSATNGDTLVIWKNPLTMVDSIIAGNSSDGVALVNGAAFTAQSTNNLLGTGGSGGLTNGVDGNLVGVPGDQLFLSSLGNNGGPTPTIALLTGSPAIDSGVAIGGLTADQRGIGRPQGNAPDMGAYEARVTVPTFTVTNLNRDLADPAFSLASASGASPAGGTFVGPGVSAGNFNPAAAGTGVHTITYSVSGPDGVAGSATFTVTVRQAPAITSGNAATFAVGTAGSFPVSVIGYPAPAVSVSGTLPSGVTFDGDTRTLSGAPVAGTGGVYPLTFTASNGAGSDAVQSFTLTVNEAPAFTSGNAATFTVGTNGSFNVGASGFPAPMFSTASGLPNGVTLSPAGVLSGTPMPGTGGVYSLTIVASNGGGSDATQNFTLTVNQAPALTSANSATFTVGNNGSFTVQTAGFPTPTLSESGTLPTGVTFTPGTGILAGTPAAGTAGAYPIQFTATNGVGSDAAQDFTLTVTDAVCTAAPEDLVAWFPGEGNATDVKGGINGSALTGASYAAGKVEQGFAFNGGTAVVEVPNNDAWDFGANAFTVQAWVKFNAVSGSDVLIGHSEGPGAVNKWIFWLKNGKLEFHLDGSAAVDIRSDAGFTPILGQWHHVAVTRSGNTYKFYVDGAQNGGDRFDSNAVPSADAPLTFGKAEAIDALNGMLDEVQIFGRALTPAEIANVYNASTQGFCTHALQSVSAVSRKTHGAAGEFDILLPLTGNPGVECRSGGAKGSHTIVFSFNNVVTAGSASVSAGSIMGTPTFTGHTMTINLSGVANAQAISVSLSDVKDGFGQTLPSVIVPMNVLLGDVNGNKMVNATDIAQVKASSGGNPLDVTNCRNDLTVDGAINASDIGMVKAASGTVVP